MRCPLFLSLALGGIVCLCGAARAQQQETRIEKILKPDMNRSFNLAKEKSFGSNAFESKDCTSINLKSLSWSQKFNSKEYLTGSFHNDKNFWMGDFKYSAGEANTKPRFSLALPGKSYDVKSATVKSAYGVEKSYEAASVPTHDFRGKEREKFNKALTPEQAAANAYDGTLTELKSIDDVRDLLNKSK